MNNESIVLLALFGLQSLVKAKVTMRDVLTILLFQCLLRRESLAQTCNTVRDGDEVSENVNK